MSARKLHVNVGTIGHIDHGKTTLTAAILAVQAERGLAKAKAYAEISAGGTVRDETKTVTIHVSHVEYETEHRHYAHIDCPGHADYVKNMKDKPFQMQIEGVYSILGRGTVATGKIEKGVVRAGEKVEIVGLKDTIQSVVTSVEQFNRQLETGEAGENVGLLLRGVKYDDIERGQVIAVPGVIQPHTNFKAEVYVLSREDGGRHTPFFTGYQPQFYFRTTDVTGSAALIGAEMCLPGDNVTMNVELRKPVALEAGNRFAIREGGKTVGRGVVVEVVK